MPRPSEVHVNKTLENISVAYLQETTEFVCPQVFPIVPVMKDSDTYFKFDTGDLLRDNMQVRPPSTPSAGADYDLTTDTYSCNRYALKQAIDWQTRANQDGELVTDSVVTKILTQKALIKFERYFASQYFTTSVWTGSTTAGDITAGTKWDAGSSTPIADVEAQRLSVRNSCGMKPNVMVVSSAVHSALKNNSDILGRLGGNERGVPTEQIMAALFEVDKYIVADVTYNSANKGATDVIAPVFGTDGVLLTYAATEPNIMSPSGGYIFASKQFASNDWGLIVRKWQDINITSDIIEVEFKLDPKVVTPKAGAFFTKVLT